MQLEPHTLRAILLLLYGAGLRVSEALALTLDDVDLTGALLTVRDTKFHKTRMVPLGAELNQEMVRYAVRRTEADHNQTGTAPFFVLRRGGPVQRPLVEWRFKGLREYANVKRIDGARYQPRLHDLRHSFAVHRLVSWYQQGTDVQKLLPQWCGTLGTIPFKRAMKREITYLEQSEMEALLAAPDRRTPQGQRDYALLLFLYNTGARADEAAQLTIGNLELAQTPTRDLSSVQIHGKGNKLRRCPLWPHTANALTGLVNERTQHEHVFLNRCGHPITRFGIHTMVERYVKRVSAKLPALATKRVSPHSLRHTTATHLLRAGVDINTIRAWLGHVSIDTTNIYAETDLEMKAKALVTCEVKETKRSRRWKEDKGLMTFLRTL